MTAATTERHDRTTGDLVRPAAGPGPTDDHRAARIAWTLAFAALVSGTSAGALAQLPPEHDAAGRAIPIQDSGAILDPTASMPPFDAGGSPFEPVPRPSTRSLFAATIAGLVAQGIGAGLADGMRGTLAQWFSPTPSRRPEPAGRIERPSRPRGTPVAKASVEPQGAGPTPSHAGLAFEIHRLGKDGTQVPVDPRRHEFRTGDQFVVRYRATLPGLATVTNVDPRGVASRIDTTTVAAGQLVTLGPYRFVGRSGEEVLRIALAPCTSPSLIARTRAIVKASPVHVALPAVRLRDCAHTSVAAATVRTRGIERVAYDGTTGFALDPVSSAERDAGTVAPRVLTIRLRHRPAAPAPAQPPLLTASIQR